MIGEAVAAAERLARAARGGEIRLDQPTWRLVYATARRAAPLPGGGFRRGDARRRAPAIRRRLDRPLIGREDELPAAARPFARVADLARAALMAILGEPGIGKSHLAAQPPAIAGEGSRVLAGRCPAYGDATAYWPLREIVEQARGARSA